MLTCSHNGYIRQSPEFPHAPAMPPGSVGFLVVGRQQVIPPIAPQVSPDRVNVIGIVLGIIVLDEKTRPVDPIVVTLALFLSHGPPP
jgi:hypothetical protein